LLHADTTGLITSDVEIGFNDFKKGAEPMAGNVIEVEEKTFAQEIKTSLPILLDFWAEWCMPCKRVSPIISEIAGALTGKLKVMKVNVDNNQDLAAQYQVMSIPTLIFLRDGQEVERIVGAVPKDSLMSKLSAVFNI
jgi:thioredoxin 1